MRLRRPRSSRSFPLQHHSLHVSLVRYNMAKKKASHEAGRSKRAVFLDLFRVIYFVLGVHEEQGQRVRRDTGICRVHCKQDFVSCLSCQVQHGGEQGQRRARPEEPNEPVSGSFQLFRARCNMGSKASELGAIMGRRVFIASMISFYVCLVRYNMEESKASDERVIMGRGVFIASMISFHVCFVRYNMEESKASDERGRRNQSCSISVSVSCHLCGKTITRPRTKAQEANMGNQSQKKQNARMESPKGNN